MIDISFSRRAAIPLIFAAIRAHGPIVIIPPLKIVTIILHEVYYMPQHSGRAAAGRRAESVYQLPPPPRSALMAATCDADLRL